MSPRLVRVIAVLSAASVLAACGGGRERLPPRGGDDPIVLIDSSAGLAPPATVWALPQYVLYADGTAIASTDDQGVVLSGTRRTLSATQIAELYRRAGDADLFRSVKYPRNIMDATALIVRIRSAEGRYETVVIQPDPADGGARGRIARFADAAPLAGQVAGPYESDRVAVVAVPGGDDTTDVRPWPLAVPAAEMPGYPYSPCLILTGAEVPPLLATVRTATVRTRWSSGKQALSLRVRPLLPHERDCDQLRRI
jgi:hypothetical protein